MHRMNLLLIFSGLLLLASCNPGSLIKKEEKKDIIDVLYYKQADIEDPLIDAVLSGENDTAIIKTKLFPPPPLQKAKQADGFRIQVFAGVDSINAASTKYNLEQQLADTVYLYSTDGLYKVQVGDFIKRQDADQIKTMLKNNGYSGAWVVNTMVFVPENYTDSLSQKQSSTIDTQNNTEGEYSIQVLVTTDRQKAENLSRDLQNRYDRPTYFSEVNNMYKVFVGKFSDRSIAEQTLSQIRNTGYPDAWLVY